MGGMNERAFERSLAPALPHSAVQPHSSSCNATPSIHVSAHIHSRDETATACTCGMADAVCCCCVHAADVSRFRRHAAASQALAPRRQGKQWRAPACPARDLCREACALTCACARVLCAAPPCAPWLQEPCRWTGCTASATVQDTGRHHLCAAHRHEQSHPSSPAVATPASPTPSPSPSMFGRPSGCVDQLTLVERAAIVTLHGVGWTGWDIAQELQCDEHAVTRWVRRWQETRTLDDSERSGRPRCTTEETDEKIAQLSDKSPTSTPKQIIQQLYLPVSPHTVSRRLDEVGLVGRVQETEHELDEFDIQRRLAFANEHINWTEDQWSHVFFSDECNFYLGQHGRQYVRRPVGQSHDPKYMHAVPQLHGKVSLWGCICAEGLGHAELYAGSLDSTRHRDILRHSLIPSFKQFFPSGPWYFQQDNVRFHTTSDTLAYLHNTGVTVIEWPPWSPDLNPIENLWNVLKARVYARFPQTLEEMEQFIREEWEATDLKFICHICRSMPRRLQLLLENKGHKISY
jgi:transposase